MSALSKAALAALLCLGAAVMAQAQTRTGESPALEWRIEVDPRIAKAAPELGAFLRRSDDGLLTEMQDAAARERADLGADFRPHDLRVTTEVKAITPGLISVLRSVGTYTGGAHGNLFLDPLTWDRRTRDFVQLDHFVTQDAAGGKALRAIAKRLRADLSARPGLWPDSIAMATVPDPAALQSFTLEASGQPGHVGGLTFHFAPYEIGPYSAGPQQATVPQSTFRAGLKPAFRAVFDGAPAQ
jgi:hypothetical protein